jgi:hypothetical protein
LETAKLAAKSRISHPCLTIRTDLADPFQVKNGKANNPEFPAVGEFSNRILRLSFEPFQHFTPVRGILGFDLKGHAMRMRRFSILTLGTLLLVSGCGKSEQAGKAPAAKAPQGFHETASADKAETKAVDAPKSAKPAMTPARSGESPPDAERSAPREPAKSEPTTAPKPVESDVAVETREEKPRQQEYRFQMRPGTLTAGSLNDHKNLDDYRQYLSEVQQSGAGRYWSPFNIGECVEIEVRDAQGNGVADVDVIVRSNDQLDDENEGIRLHASTRADGKTFFATGLDARSQDETYELTVKPRGGQAIVKEVSTAQTPWVVELPDVTRQLPGQLDLALVIDTTSSMSDELNYLKVELDNIVATVHRMFPNVQQRYALIVYRDEGDEYVVRNVIDFTDSLADFRSKLAAQSAQGGGDLPEAMHIALENSTKLSWRHENTARVMFLVADAPPHNQHVDRSFAAVHDLRHQGVAVYPLAASGVMGECEYLMRAAAFLTRGQYLFLTDHSGIGNPHSKPTAPKYEVEPLNQLIVRMIASELSGKPVLAQEIIATEESDGSPPPPIPQEQNQSSVVRPGEHLAVAQPVPQSGTPVYVSVWDTTWFRIVVAVVFIVGILFLDNRLRA